MQSIMKEQYLPALQVETFFNAGALSEAFGMRGIGTTVNDSGNGIWQPVLKGTIGSVGALKDNLTLGKASHRLGADKFLVESKGFQANIALTYYEYLRMQNSEAVFVDLFEDQMGTITDDLKRQWARQLYGSSHGKITTVVSATDVAGTSMIKVKVADIRPFRIGELVSFEGVVNNDKGFTPETAEVAGPRTDALASNAGKAAGSRVPGRPYEPVLASFKIHEIDYVDGAIIINHTDEFISRLGITIAAADITADLEVFYSLSDDGEMNGLEDLIVSKTAYFGLKADGTYNKADEFKAGTERPSFFKATTADVAGTGFVTEDIVEKVLDDLEQTTGEQPDFFVTSRATKRSIASFPCYGIQIQRPSTASPMGDVRGFGYDVNKTEVFGTEINVDRHAPKGNLYMLKLDSFDMVMLQDLKWDDFTGSIWKQQTDSKGNQLLAYSADMVAWKNMFSKNPRNNAVITGISKQVVLNTAVLPTGYVGKDVKELGEA